MLKFLRKVYRRYFKNKNVQLQKWKEEFNMLRQEIIELREQNLNNKMLISNNINVVDNHLYFVEDEHIYEEIKEHTYQNINNYEVELSQPIISDVAPQLPARNKINSIKF